MKTVEEALETLNGGIPFFLKDHILSYPLQRCETSAVMPDMVRHHSKITDMSERARCHLIHRIVTEWVTTQTTKVSLLNDIFIVGRIKCGSLLQCVKI